MRRERIGSLIHNARNRLFRAMDRLDESAASELHAVASQLATVMALLRADDPAEALRRDEVHLELFFSDLAAEIGGLAPPHLQTLCAADFSGGPFPCWIFDSQLVRLVLIDALMNAWRHARRQVRLLARCQGQELHFRVEDDGPGFPPAWLAIPPAAGTPSPRGTGQGLELAQRIAQLHGIGERRGRIELANDEIHGGARFSLILP